MISQRDIIEVPFNLPQGIIHHPAIVLSNNDAIREEEAFIALMLTTEKANDLYTFEITSDMVSKKLHVPYCEARLHLISFFRTKETVPNSHYNNKIKQEFFEELIKQVNRITFGLELL